MLKPRGERDAKPVDAGLLYMFEMPASLTQVHTCLEYFRAVGTGLPSFADFHKKTGQVQKRLLYVSGIFEIQSAGLRHGFFLPLGHFGGGGRTLPGQLESGIIPDAESRQ